MCIVRVRTHSHASTKMSTQLRGTIAREVKGAKKLTVAPIARMPQADCRAMYVDDCCWDDWKANNLLERLVEFHVQTLQSDKTIKGALVDLLQLIAVELSGKCELWCDAVISMLSQDAQLWQRIERATLNMLNVILLQITAMALMTEKLWLSYLTFFRHQVEASAHVSNVDQHSWQQRQNMRILWDKTAARSRRADDQIEVAYTTFLSSFNYGDFKITVHFFQHTLLASFALAHLSRRTRANVGLPTVYFALRPPCVKCSARDCTQTRLKRHVACCTKGKLTKCVKRLNSNADNENTANDLLI